MKILGIDPGTNILGYAIITTDKSKPFFILSGKISMNKIDNPHLKLQKILEKTNHIIQEYKPKEMSIEAPFYGKNVQSMLKLGRAQGVAIAAGMNNKLKVFEYSPRKIKQAITGNGNASKEQVAQMIKSILRIKKMPDTFDETDAIAAALAHFYQRNKISANKSYSGWKDFLSKNPDKLK